VIAISTCSSVFGRGIIEVQSTVVIIFL